jgi:hypothetical protein
VTHPLDVQILLFLNQFVHHSRVLDGIMAIHCASPPAA